MADTLQEQAERAVNAMHRSNSDAALQCAIELMLTDRRSGEVVAALRSWADYLEERR